MESSSNCTGDIRCIDNRLQSLFCSIFGLYSLNFIITIYNKNRNLRLGISKDKPKLNILDNKDGLYRNFV